MKLLAVTLALTLSGHVSAFSIAPPAWKDQPEDLDQALPDDSKIIIDTPIGHDPMTPSAVVSSVRYGPFPLPAGGMVSNELLIDVKKPCSDCFIVAIQSRLEDNHRNELVTESGFWLHHVILFNRARPDLTCLAAGERFYGGSNAKATRRWNLHGRWGYRARENDKWDLVVDVRNQGAVNVEAVVRVDFEWVSASSAEGKRYREIRPIWLSLDDYFCGGLGLPPVSTTEPFRIRTPSFVSPIQGPIVDVAAHMHDGALDMVTYLNGHVICHSAQLYGKGPEPHIIGQGTCKNVGRLKIGDVLVGEVRYDPTKHRMIVEPDGQPERIMGNDGLYIGVE